MVIGCSDKSSIGKLKEELESEKIKREEDSKKYVEVLNRLHGEMKLSEEKDKLIADLRHELDIGVRAQESVAESQDSPPSSSPPLQEGNREEVGLTIQDTKLNESLDKLIQLANNFYWDGDYAVAKEIYGVIVDWGNADADILFRLARCYGVTPETDKAISLYQKVIASLEHNDTSNQLYHQAYNNLGGMYKKTGAYKEAELAYVRAIEINEEYTNAYYNLGLLYEDNLDDELGAIACYEKYIELGGERSTYIKKLLDEIKARD
jgi:tetratricopeptide (TPR) repeat protein